MQLALDGSNYNLIDHNGDVVGELNAKDVLGKIVESAWATGDPGILFLDRLDRDNPTPHIGRIDGVNPSLTGDTRVLTSLGVVPISELDGKTFNVVTMSGETSKARCFKSGVNSELYEITLSNGIKYRATPEHKWPILQKDGTVAKLPTSKMEVGNWIPFGHCNSLPYGNEGTYDEGFLIGWNYGDGCIIDRGECIQYNFTFGHEDIENGIYEKVKSILTSITGHTYNPEPRNRGGKDWIELNVRDKRVSDLFTKFMCGKKEDGIPSTIFTIASEEFRKGFIDGLLSADSYISSSKIPGICINSSRRKLVDDLSDLLGYYGIKTSVNSQIYNTASFPNGKKYDRSYQYHTLRIGLSSLHRFRDLFTITHRRKSDTIMAARHPYRNCIHYNNIKVKSVRKLDEREDVWDIEVFDHTHTFKLSHCVTGNCGEIRRNL